LIEAKVYREDWEVEPRLQALGTTKAELIEIVRKAVTARSDATDDDAITAAGTFSYHFGLRALRQTFRAKGCEIDRTDNIEATYDPVRGIKFIFQNAESACDPFRGPKAVREKGPAAIRAIELGQPSFFSWINEEAEKRAKASRATIWCLFVYACGDDVRAELSCPHLIEDGQYGEFHERIFIVQAGEWSDLVFKDDDEPGPTQDYEISVTRK
jgi:hypothetical protein